MYILTLTNPKVVMDEAFLTTPIVFLSRYPTPTAAPLVVKVLSVTKIVISAPFLIEVPSRPSGIKQMEEGGQTGFKLKIQERERSKPNLEISVFGQK